ncbi:MAG TPA: hypothetical protein PLM04_04940, partial [Paludibacteraceae bacterium]|nr:hypothetical protein [Paludibacteraceae bacterium]
FCVTGQDSSPQSLTGHIVKRCGQFKKTLMKHLKILTIIVLTLIWTCGFGQTDIDNEIISALINSEFKSLPNDTIFNRKGEIKRIKTYKKTDILLIIETETFLFDPEVDSFDRFKNETNGLPSLDSLTYLDFIDKNKTKIQIDSIYGFQGTITYNSRQEIDNIFKQGGWDNYHKIHGYKSMIKVSRPGLNKNMTKAFIYYSSSSGGLSGAGFYLILENIDGKWIVKESMLAWIS